MNCFCPCSMSPTTGKPEAHTCTFARPDVVAAIVARPVETVHDWRKRGLVNAKSVRDGRVRWHICVCETAAVAKTAESRWQARTGWSVPTTDRDQVGRSSGVAC